MLGAAVLQGAAQSRALHIEVSLACRTCVIHQSSRMHQCRSRPCTQASHLRPFNSSSLSRHASQWEGSAFVRNSTEDNVQRLQRQSSISNSLKESAPVKHISLQQPGWKCHHQLRSNSSSQLFTALGSRSVSRKLVSGDQEITGRKCDLHHR